MVAAAVYPGAPMNISPRQHALRTYVVLTAKPSRARLTSFEETYSTASSSSSSAASSPATSPLRSTGKKLLSSSSSFSSSFAVDPLVPNECLAYESYAAVASRFQAATASSSSPTRDLRWSDISRPQLQSNGKPLSQKARKRLLRRTRSASGNAASPNDHLECHALELCFEFLGLADLQRATAVCTEFRDVITSSGRLVVALYARQWRAPGSTRMARAYATLGFAPALAMVQQRRGDVAYPLTTRSLVTQRTTDGTYEILNNSMLRVLTRGAVDSVRGVHALPVQPCARALGHAVSYFEVAMSGCGSVGVVSLSDPVTRRAYGYGSDEHVGWKGVACGYHGNDGDFVFNTGASPYGGEWTPYGPSWGVHTTSTSSAVSVSGVSSSKPSSNGEAGDTTSDPAWSTVGCGLDLAARRVFFTLNGTFLGFASFVLPSGEFAAAVSLHEFGDRAVLNAGSAPFTFDLEGFCASL